MGNGDKMTAATREHNQTRLVAMYQMRQSGASLQKVGQAFGVSRERVRVLLVKHYGSTRMQGLLTTAEVARLARCTRSYVFKLARGVIQPAAVVGRNRKLWQPETIATVIMYIDSHRCPVCNEPLPSSRWLYCSKACYCSGRKSPSSSVANYLSQSI